MRSDTPGYDSRSPRAAGPPVAHGPQGQHRDHAHAPCSGDGPNKSPQPRGRGAIAAALQLHKGPADEKAAQAAHDDGGEGRRPGPHGG